MDRRALACLLCTLTLASAGTAAAQRPTTTPVAPTSQGTTTTGATTPHRACPQLPARVAVLLAGKSPCRTAPPAAVDETDPPTAVGCGLPGDTRPRCPTTVDVGDPGSTYTVRALASPDGRAVHVVGSAGQVGNVLVSYDPSTGERLRTTTLRTPTGTYVRDAALSADGRHLVVGGASNRGAVAYVVDVRSGRLQWTYQLAKTGFLHSVNAVDVDGSRVLLAIGRKEAKGTFVDDWLVSGHSLRTGARLWSHLVGAGDGVDEYPTDMAALRGDRLVVVGTQQAGPDRTDYDAVTRTYDTRTGRLLATEVLAGQDEGPEVDESWWAADRSADRRRVAAVGTRADYTGPGQALVAVHTGTGRAAWRQALTSVGDTQAYGVAFARDRVVVAAQSAAIPPLMYLLPAYGTASSLLVGLDGATGEELWRTSTGGGPNTWADSVAASPDGRTAYAVGNSTPVLVAAYEPIPVGAVAHRSPADAYVVAVGTGDGAVAWTSRWSAAEESSSYTYLYTVAATAGGLVASGFAERTSTRYVGSSYVAVAQAYPLVVRYEP